MYFCEQRECVNNVGEDTYRYFTESRTVVKMSVDNYHFLVEIILICKILWENVISDFPPVAPAK